MSAVHVGIRHDNHFMIAELGGVKFFTDTGAQSYNDRLKFIVSVNFIRTGLFHVQHLTPQRQDCLETGVTALGSGTACRVTFHDVDFGEENKKQLMIPRGFGHGFITLTDHVEFLYKADNFYAPEADGGIRWNDPELNIDWGTDSPILSDKDANAPFLKDAVTDF